MGETTTFANLSQSEIQSCATEEVSNFWNSLFKKAYGEQQGDRYTGIIMSFLERLKITTAQYSLISKAFKDENLREILDTYTEPQSLSILGGVEGVITIFSTEKNIRDIVSGVHGDRMKQLESLGYSVDNEGVLMLESEDKIEIDEETLKCFTQGDLELIDYGDWFFHDDTLVVFLGEQRTVKIYKNGESIVAEIITLDDTDILEKSTERDWTDKRMVKGGIKYVKYFRAEQFTQSNFGIKIEEWRLLIHDKLPDSDICDPRGPIIKDLPNAVELGDKYIDGSDLIVEVWNPITMINSRYQVSSDGTSRLTGTAGKGMPFSEIKN